MEIFCPDWRGGSIFLSHMGEINPEVAAETPRLREKDFPWTRAQNPAVITCAPQPGPAVLVNLAPGPDGTFGLILAPVEVLGDATNPALHDSIRGWIRPAIPLGLFLERYSRLGGTHHSALVLGNGLEALKAFSVFAGIEHAII
jgi:L-arabinose isomerase